MDIILFGGPGSGKGTQAERLQARLGIAHISSGELFRENIRNATELGMLAKTYIDQGKLVPDEVTVGMIRARLQNADTASGVLFDGFPRTLPQAKALDELLACLDRRIDLVINLTVSDEEIVRRLSGRLICRECEASFHREFNPFQSCPENRCNGEYLYQREDDKPETVRERLRVFHRQTTPLIEYYQKKGVLVTVNGEGYVEQVTEVILNALKRLEEETQG
jgi:adenylate kinase